MVGCFATQRDAWDWLQNVSATFAAVAALIGFVFWILRQLRRPEVEFLWRISTTGKSSDLRAWSPQEIPEIRPGQSIMVEASLRNVGDAVGETSLTNFVAPDCFELRSHSPSSTTEQVLSSQNPIAGLPPMFGVHFIAKERPFPPGIDWQLRYVLVLSEETRVEGVRLLQELYDDRLNARGRRRLPVLYAPSQAEEKRPFGTSWPPPRRRRRPRFVRADPPAEPIECTTAVRRSVRDLRVIFPREPSRGV